MVVNTDWYADWIYGIIQETWCTPRSGARHRLKVPNPCYGERGASLRIYAGERPSSASTIDDLQAFKTVLAKLHSLEIVYGSLSSDSFLILENGQALLHGFGGSFATDHKPPF